VYYQPFPIKVAGALERPVHRLHSEHCHDSSLKVKAAHYYIVRISTNVMKQAAGP